MAVGKEGIMIDAILFDLDGTLMDSVTDLAATLNQLLNEKGFPTVSVEKVTRNVSNGASAMIADAFSASDQLKQLNVLKKRFLTIYQERLENNCTTVLYPKVEKLLKAIDNKGIPWGIVTNKSKIFSSLLLNKHNLTQRCSVLVCAEDVNESKPSPEGLLKACERISCAPINSLFIGDSEVDIIAGNKANMSVIAAHYGYQKEILSTNKLTVAFDAFCSSDILPWLESIQWQL